MVWLEIIGMKGFERYSGSVAGGYVSQSPLEASINGDEEVSVYHIKEQSTYVRTNSQEGWIPTNKLKFVKQKVMIDEICELDLKLQFKSSTESKILHPTYKNSLDASIDFCCELQQGEEIALGILLSDEVIASVKIKIDPLILSSLTSSGSTLKEYELFTENYKLHYLVLSAKLAVDQESLSNSRVNRSLKSMEHIYQDTIILSTKVNAVLKNVSISGTLFVTQFKIYLSSESFSFTECFGVYIQCIKSLKLSAKSLSLTTKDARSIEIYSDINKLLLETISPLLDSPLQSCIDYYSKLNPQVLSTPLTSSFYIMSEEFERLKCENIRISYINIDYRLCDSYPCLLYFPSQITDSLLAKVSSFRSRCRIPTITWTRAGVSLYRSSQPKLGLGKRSADDELFFSLARIKYVIDARPGMNAKANRLKGKGYELEDFYNIRLRFMNIQNIHHVARSFEAMSDLANRKAEFWAAFNEAKWMSHVMLILQAAMCSANYLVLEKANVLVHCSDGWDRTSQITALTQVLIDPFYRTIKGLQNLIYKDWFAFGHKFFDRTFGSEFSPIFVLFLDCLGQIVNQNPGEFEYNEEYLIFLAEANLQGIYGEFLCNSEKDRIDIVMRTSNVFAVHNANYTNQSYFPGFYNILPISIEPHRLQVWRFFTRYY